MPESHETKDEPKTRKSIKNPHKRTIIIITCSVVLVAIVAGAAYLYDNDSSVSVDQPEPINYAEIDEVDAFLASQEYEDSGDVDSALSVYDELINKAEDDQNKAELFLIKARVLQRNDRTNEAIEYAREALELSESFSILLELGALQESLGDREGAISSYERAIDRQNESSVVDQQEINALELIIEELKED